MLVQLFQPKAEVLRRFGGLPLIAMTLLVAGAGIAHAGSYYEAAHPSVSCSGPNPCLKGLNSGSGSGVLGSATSGAGLMGKATTGSAVVGSSAGSNPAISGNNTNSSLSGGVGVAGSSIQGYGVSGSSQTNYGVYGASTNVSGVFGISSSAAGVYGQSIATDAASVGVYGAGSTYGVEGSSGKTGVYGTTGNGYGVYGYTVDGYGVVGIAQQSGVGVEAISGGFNTALLVIGGTSGTGNYNVINALNSNRANMFVVSDVGNVGIAGLLYTNGSCKSGCSRTRHVRSYGAQSSTPMIDDVGEATLRSGRAYVALDAAFANAMDDSKPYIVLVTPEGDTDGIFVARRNPAGFEVREVRGGRSSIPFAYRIVAHPFGKPDQRLPFVVDQKVPQRLLVSGREKNAP
jgi:hypothetical protein